MYKPGGTVRDAIRRIEQNNYVLPAIQREFVWQPEQNKARPKDAKPIIFMPYRQPNSCQCENANESMIK